MNTFWKLLFLLHTHEQVWEIRHLYIDIEIDMCINIDIDIDID